MEFIFSSGCPVYKRTSRGLELRDILEICLATSLETEKVCKRVPSHVTENAVFVVDLKKVHPKDLTVDDHGIYGAHSSPTIKVKVTFDVNNSIKSFHRVTPSEVSNEHNGQDESKVFIVRKHYSWHKSLGISRIVTKIQAEEQLLRFAIIQYKVSAERNEIQSSHGNSKKLKEPYFRTRPSVLDQVRHLGKHHPAKAIISLIQEEAGGAVEIDSPSDIPRDRRQVYNALQKVPGKLKCRNTGPKKVPEIGKLLGLLGQSEFLKDVSLNLKTNKKGIEAVYPNTFAATDMQLNWIRAFCNGQFPLSQVGVDTTYNIGPFYLTAMTFPHPMFVLKKSPQKHPTIFLGMSTSASRDVADYHFLASSLQKFKIKTLTYGTDGEIALEQGFENVFPIEGVDKSTCNIHLRCFDHVKQDMKFKLDQLDVSEHQQKTIIKKLIGGEYGGTRELGLVDCREEEFEEQLKKLEIDLPEDFRKWLLQPRGRIRPLTETFKKCMLASVRTAAGLGNPPNKFDNQRNEAFNTTIKEEARRCHIDQVTIHELVEEKIVKVEREELTKAIYGMGEYRLAEDYKHLQVDMASWFRMTGEQRCLYVRKILEPEPTRVGRKPQFICPDVSLPNVSKQKLLEIWNAAKKFIENGKCIQLESGDWCLVTRSDSAVVNKLGSLSYRCKCQNYKANGIICEHIVVVAEKGGNLSAYLDKAAKKDNAAFKKIFSHVPKSAGDKPSKNRRGKNNVEKAPIVSVVQSMDIRTPRQCIFTEYYHNDKNFQMVFIKDFKEAKVCNGCNNEIPRRFLTIPFDIIFLHMERYEYPLKDENGAVLRMAVTRKKMAKRFYCIRSSCILPRHPYFWIGRIETSPDVKAKLTESHLDFLKKEMGGYQP